MVHCVYSEGGQSSWTRDVSRDVINARLGLGLGLGLGFGFGLGAHGLGQWPCYQL